ncbi:MAG: RNA polymerase sigma factor, partial [Chloroflexota bacterium]
DENEIDPETSAEKLNSRKIIWSALGELSDKLRETVILRHYEGLTYQEIGGILNIPPKTVESRMRLAHKALRDILREDL